VRDAQIFRDKFNSDAESGCMKQNVKREGQY
jgi:hypothetical protein